MVNLIDFPPLLVLPHHFCDHLQTADRHQLPSQLDVGDEFGVAACLEPFSAAPQDPAERPPRPYVENQDVQRVRRTQPPPPDHSERRLATSPVQRAPHDEPTPP